MAKKTTTAAAAAKAAALKSSKHSASLLSLDPLVDPVYANGEIRSYLVTDPSPTVLKKRSFLGVHELYLVAALALASFYVRLYNLSYPKSVVFDEVHFGGFSRKYILGTYFMDVHPPLAKMLFAAVGALGGFKGDFEFKSIGDYFPEGTPYVLMRQFPAVLGVGTVLLAYFTLRQSGVRPIIAAVTAFLLIIENSNVTISRYILLDSPLLFFIAAAVYAWKKFEIQTPFSANWFRALLATGVALGLALSSKWVGLFTVAWVGLLCVYQLWFIIGDLSVSSKKVVAHFFFRGTVLLGVPIALYIFFFAIHFRVLYKEGDGGAFMSSAFRAGLEGNTIPKNILAQVGLGSTVTIRHLDTQGGYLHSHEHYYPTGSKQQQITLYPHLDSNNQWFIEPYLNTTVYNETFVPLTNGMKIRLRHVNTGRRLHSHDEKPPVSERDWQKEASCYGFDGFGGDANDDWVVEIVDYKTPKGEAQENVIALTSIIRFKHAMTGHYLFSSEVKLPEWGFGQQEVTAASSGRRALTMWYIETNNNPYLNRKQARIINYPKLSLWQKVVEAHKRMWKINQGLTNHHNWQSDPQDWPFLLRGINYWVRENKQVYFMGNAVVWWATTTTIFSFITYALVNIVRWWTGSPVGSDKNVYNFNVQTFSYVLGWALHYLPFFIMGRQLFLHHYLPALYFGILALGHFLEIFTSYLLARNRALQNVAYGVVVIFVILSTLFYINYSSLIYATPWTKDKCNAAKALSTWDFDCKNFHDSLAEYSSETTSNTPTSSFQRPSVDSIVEQNKEALETPLAAQKAAVKQDDHLSEEKAKKQAKKEEPVEENLPQVVPPLAVDLEETPQVEDVQVPVELEETPQAEEAEAPVEQQDTPEVEEIEPVIEPESEAEAEAESVKEEPVKEEPVKEEPPKEETPKEEPVKEEEPAKDEAVKDEPAKDE
ncbi:dolichyl-phosphate-D-mannose:protein O-D-mannosyltransferase [Scheffersomyces xylosifermentans]|uniref:dolichyl-phosphate-D-mannose:protein O-D-mannosyltransferase n=1 Tax=Scheffersomyces xylosifermentans TaxID=1304137 RepID=UPI00315CA6B6